MSLFAFRLVWLGTILAGAVAGFCLGWTVKGHKTAAKEIPARQDPSTVQALLWRDHVVN